MLLLHVALVSETALLVGLTVPELACKASAKLAGTVEDGPICVLLSAK